MASSTNDLHIILLEKIRDIGFGVPVDISIFLDDHFSGRVPVGVIFINELIEKKLIYFIDENTMPSIKNRFAEIEIKVFSLANNIDYLRNRYVEQDNFLSNGFTRKYLKKQTWIFFATASFALAAVGTSILGIILDSTKKQILTQLEHQARELKELSRENSQLRVDSTIYHQTVQNFHKSP